MTARNRALLVDWIGLKLARPLHDLLNLSTKFWFNYLLSWFHYFLNYIYIYNLLIWVTFILLKQWCWKNGCHIIISLKQCIHDLIFYFFINFQIFQIFCLICFLVKDIWFKCRFIRSLCKTIFLHMICYIDHRSISMCFVVQLMNNMTFNFFYFHVWNLYLLYI